MKRDYRFKNPREEEDELKPDVDSIKPKYVARFNQGDCMKCDGYDMTCKGYIPYIDNQYVAPCKVSWNIDRSQNVGELEMRIHN